MYQTLREALGLDELSRHDVERVLTGLRISVWLDGVDVDSFYDHLEAVLGQDAAPAIYEIEELTERLRRALMQLVAMVLAQCHHQPGAEASGTSGRARALRAERPPGDFLPARRHLRRLALVTQDLLDLLAED
ncbi:DUF6415 family natural product biosynthesis protein [Streptomyces sp. NBC_00879]|uniref:DUF6415 family natural product biosynthesis protein n=1 Tax=Streptomyces sp. NBC_00879 TaxID=2975855 RepID=UPI00386B5AAA|nr:DUF6415 family natural product biosynthesis protein [Streptomyces sp. NBC_00879]